jgi:adenylosuccinate synthase
VGTGAVADLDFLEEESSQLSTAGISVDGLRISDRAQLVMPYHLLLDGLADEARGRMTIGTTRRGVGPTYVDKAERVGIQVGDLLDEDMLARKLQLVLPQKNRILQDIYQQQPLDMGRLLQTADRWRQKFGHLIVDQVLLLTEALEHGDAVLLEGQLGAMRDLDWGTYPFVTSSTTIAGGGAVGGGIPPMLIERVVGVVKAYTTSVGTGPMPTELEGSAGDELRDRGAEYGATTGRPRRVGWFDGVAARYAGRLNRFSGIAVTKLDVLDGMPSLKICTAYRADGKIYDTVPMTGVLERAVPCYEEMSGWEEPTRGARTWADLPPQAQGYLRRIEELVGAPITMVSVGQARDETIVGSADGHSLSGERVATS